MNDPETDKLDFKVKVKFFALEQNENFDTEEPVRLRLKLVKK